MISSARPFLIQAGLWRSTLTYWVREQASLEASWDPQAEKKKIDDYTVVFEDLKLENFKNYKAVIGNFKIDNNKKKLNLSLNPEIRIYQQPSTLTYEASIRTGILKDYYLTMSNIDRSDYYNIKFQKKPFMLWIWVSVILISAGGLVRLFKNENKIS